MWLTVERYAWVLASCQSTPVSIFVIPTLVVLDIGSKPNCMVSPIPAFRMDLFSKCYGSQPIRFWYFMCASRDLCLATCVGCFLTFCRRHVGPFSISCQLHHLLQVKNAASSVGDQSKSMAYRVKEGGKVWRKKRKKITQPLFYQREEAIRGCVCPLFVTTPTGECKNSWSQYSVAVVHCTPVCFDLI